MGKVKMNEKRAKHCLVMVEDPRDAYNKLVLAIGGITVRCKRDPYLKRTTQRHVDLASVEYFSLKERKWERFNAKLQIARHQASASYINGYIYVIGGHTVDFPDKFINTIERCHKSVPSSNFERINIKQS